MWKLYHFKQSLKVMQNNFSSALKNEVLVTTYARIGALDATLFDIYRLIALS